MTKDSLRDLYVDELKDIYNAENQLVKALPKMVKAASSDQLRQAFEEHLEQTKGQVERLDQVFKMLGEKAIGKKCHGMEGLVKQGTEIMQDDYEDDVLDAGLISAAQRVEHYEIAAYGTVCAYAGLLDKPEQSSLLGQNLEEEKKADQKLTELSEQINVEANKSAPVSDSQQKGKRRSKRAA